ncbi:hypothetical protein HYQ46_012887 [Verticillium longisporum]|nr:hypothetical protein HYQ44_008548 [Verticillium longisporum]KAG7151347.1 hypothetical protein HYQ46_012887 [Verticillium longisporum]
MEHWRPPFIPAHPIGALGHTDLAFWTLDIATPLGQPARLTRLIDLPQLNEDPMPSRSRPGSIRLWMRLFRVQAC